MIQFNLLPDIKLEYIKAKRTKRTVILVAGMLSAVTFTIFMLLFFTVNVLQKQHIADLSEDINQQKNELSSYEDLDKILTIQSQLGSVTGLHEQKPATSRLFSYLPQVVPQAASLSSLELNYEAMTMEINGTADSLTTINKFVDTLKFTQYTDTETQTKANAFSEVVLEGYDLDVGEADFIIELKFDPLIFNAANKITLTVPEIISTRSETEKPSEDIFINEVDSGASQ